MLKYLKIIIGGWHYLFTFCPECNSSAPYLYDCPVCEYKRVPKKYWWRRFIDNINDKPLPSFTFKCTIHNKCKYVGTKIQVNKHIGYWKKI